MIALSLVFFLYIFCNLDTAVAMRQRIMGGKTTDITKVPYQVSLESGSAGGDYYQHICGAVIIDKQWALTAAHCVEGEDQLRVRAGETLLGHGKVYVVNLTIMHPHFREVKNDYDVALLKMETPFRFSSSVRPIPLATEVPPIGTPATVSGWGLTKEGQFAPKLQKLQVEIFPSQKCSETLQGTFTERMLCAGTLTKGKDTCKGDSGGPLESGGKLIGIVSWGSPCSRGGAPGVYANVTNLSGWIKEVLELKKLS